MPTPVTRFVTKDGKEFKTEREAKHHELATDVVKAIGYRDGSMYPALIHLQEHGFTIVRKSELVEINDD